MTARIWRGRRAGDADAYSRYVERTGIRDSRREVGMICRGDLWMHHFEVAAMRGRG